MAYLHHPDHDAGRDDYAHTDGNTHEECNHTLANGQDIVHGFLFPQRVPDNPGVYIHFKAQLLRWGIAVPAFILCRHPSLFSGELVQGFGRNRHHFGLPCRDLMMQMPRQTLRRILRAKRKTHYWTEGARRGQTDKVKSPHRRLEARR